MRLHHRAASAHGDPNEPCHSFRIFVCRSLPCTCGQAAEQFQLAEVGSDQTRNGTAHLSDICLTRTDSSSVTEPRCFDLIFAVWTPQPRLAIRKLHAVPGIERLVLCGVNVNPDVLVLTNQTVLDPLSIPLTPQRLITRGQFITPFSQSLPLLGVIAFPLFGHDGFLLLANLVALLFACSDVITIR